MRPVAVSQHLRVLLLALLVSGLLSPAHSHVSAEGVVLSEVGTTSQDPSRVLQMKDSQITGYVQLLVENGFPQERMDELYLLALNRAEIVFPILEQGLIASLTTKSWSDEKIHRAADVIAYVADESAIEVICRLAAMDLDRLLPLLERSLNYSVGRRNSYQLVYRALDCENLPAAETAIRWAGEWLNKYGATRRGYPQLAEAVVARAEARREIPEGTSVAADPLLRALYGSEIPLNVLHEIERVREQMAHTRLRYGTFKK